jgi:hypothetical protein
MVGSSHESDGVREVVIVLFAIVVYHLLRLASLICRHVCTSLEPSDHAGPGGGGNGTAACVHVRT